MKTRSRSQGRSAQSDEFGWIDSILSERGAARYGREDGESHLIRTVFVLLLLGGLTCLLGYFIHSVWAGEGRQVFPLVATLALLLGCFAVVSRTGIVLRAMFLLGSLCAFALLVDQFAYYRWHQRMEGVVSGLQQGAESAATVPSAMQPGPTSFRIDPDGEILLKFEPPVLAWMYHLDSASPIGHTLVAGWYRILSKATRGRNLDGVARTIVRPHEVYAVSVQPDEAALVCRADEPDRWTLSIDTRRGRRPL